VDTVVQSSFPLREIMTESDGNRSKDSYGAFCALERIPFFKVHSLVSSIAASPMPPVIGVESVTPAAAVAHGETL
jgi:hypothetical protein